MIQKLPAMPFFADRFFVIRTVAPSFCNLPIDIIQITVYTVYVRGCPRHDGYDTVSDFAGNEFTRRTSYMKKAIGIILLAVALLPVLCTFASCYRVPDENRKLPSENCVMVYTISDKESIRILYNPDSNYHLCGEWIKDQTTTPVHLDAYNIPSTFSCSDGGYVVSIETFDPDEKDSTYASEKDWIFNKGVLNSSEIRKQYLLRTHAKAAGSTTLAGYRMYCFLSQSRTEKYTRKKRCISGTISRRKKASGQQRI